VRRLLVTGSVPPHAALVRTRVRQAAHGQIVSFVMGSVAPNGASVCIRAAHDNSNADARPAALDIRLSASSVCVRLPMSGASCFLAFLGLLSLLSEGPRRSLLSVLKHAVG